MAYTIGVATSNGQNVDLSFGEATEFYIYEVNDEGAVSLRVIKPVPDEKLENYSQCGDGTCLPNEGGRRCGDGSGCGSHHGDENHHAARINLLLDCRCVLCKKIGYKVAKELEKRAIAVFDIEYSVSEALEKILKYYKHVL